MASQKINSFRTLAEALASVKPKSKYGNKQCTIGGEKYRSQREANRHQALLLQQRAGAIANLRREIPYVLAPSVQIKGRRKGMNKYSAIKTEINGIIFDSKAEARRYSDLVLLQRAGKISGLTLQVPFELAPGLRLLGDKRARPAIRIIVDFSYIEEGKQVFEDTKGFDTPLGRAKRHFLKHIHNVDVRISR